MPVHAWKRGTCMGAIVLLSGGCERQAPNTKTATAVANPVATAVAAAGTPRGLATGDSIAPFEVACAIGGRRVLATPGSAQLVTFSTPGDCSTCIPHLRGLSEVASSGRGPRDNVIVVYAPGQLLPELSRQYGQSRDVCLDSAGRAWDALDLQKTPVTVLLLSGRVAMVTGRGLLSDSSQAAFVAEIASLTGARK